MAPPISRLDPHATTVPRAPTLLPSPDFRSLEPLHSPVTLASLLPTDLSPCSFPHISEHAPGPYPP